jgi:archaellum biogenesis ATPase FlaH
MTFDFMPLSGTWKDLLGRQTRSGLWLIYGPEKNGKTTFSLMLANHLSALETVLYVSAEEGVGDTLADTCHKAGISDDNKSIRLLEYTSIEDLLERFKKRKSERIVFIDNLLVYRKEITEETLLRLKQECAGTLFIFVAHEKDNDPYPGVAEVCRRLAKVVIRVQGMVAEVRGRGGAGGTFVIDETTAMLNRGSAIIDNPKNSIL